MKSLREQLAPMQAIKSSHDSLPVTAEPRNQRPPRDATPAMLAQHANRLLAEAQKLQKRVPAKFLPRTLTLAEMQHNNRRKMLAMIRPDPDDVSDDVFHFVTPADLARDVKRPPDTGGAMFKAMTAPCPFEAAWAKSAKADAAAVAAKYGDATEFAAFTPF